MRRFSRLTTSIDASMREDYQLALDAYEKAKAQIAQAERSDDVTE